MRNILVPTDFSAAAGKALDFAGRLAKNAGAQLILVHCCSLLSPKFSRHAALIREHNQTLVKELYGRLHGSRQKVQAQTGVQALVSLYDGEDITGSILAAAKDNKADLVVMGTYGASGLRRQLLGSKVAEVINLSEVPVLTIPPHYEWNEPDKVVLAIEDYYTRFDIVEPAFRIAALFGGTVTVTVFTPEEAEAFEVITHTRCLHTVHQRLQREYPEAQMKVVHLGGREFQDSVQRYIDDNQIDVLAMLTHKRGFLENLWDASLTQRMSYYSKVPLLSLHVKDDA